MRVYFVGIGGIGMSGVAGLAKSLGFEVWGSERGPLHPPSSEILKILNIPVLEPRKENIHSLKPHFLVVGNTISRDHPEIEEAFKLNLPLLSFPDFIKRYLLPERKSLVVAGTHGKTTSSALLAHILKDLGEGVTFLVGGMLNNFQRNYHFEQGKWLVLEGDEYPSAFFDIKAKFLHYEPYGLILTSLEFDHGDVYKDIFSLKEAFGDLLKKVKRRGIVVYNEEDPNLKEIISLAPQNFKKVSYGIDKGDYKLVEYKSLFVDGVFQTQCLAEDPQGERFSFQHQLLGLHNSLNILSVIALMENLGFDRNRILQAIKRFKGVKRRQEIIFYNERVCLIDDFAHHPTAVTITLREIQKAINPSQTILFFEPRTNTSKRKIFQEEYLKALHSADIVFLKIPPNLDKIPIQDRIDLEYIVKNLRVKGREAFILDGRNFLNNLRALPPKSLIIFMSSVYMEEEIKEVLTFLEGYEEGTF